jgi:hypothetical protein
MRVKLLILSTLVALSTLIGCAEQPEPTSPEPVITDMRIYFPTNPASTWSYAGYGNEFAAFTRKVLLKQGDQVQIMEDNGGTRMGQVYQVTAETVIQTYSTEEYYSDKNLLGEKSNRHLILLKAPLKAGAVWQDDRDKHEVLSINETVQVPAGTFSKVIKVKITSLDSQQEAWQFEYYAPHTGLIMREFMGKDYAIASKLKVFTDSR